jgi:hypothetical protein
MQSTWHILIFELEEPPGQQPGRLSAKWLAREAGTKRQLSTNNPACNVARFGDVRSSEQISISAPALSVLI